MKVSVKFKAIITVFLSVLLLFSLFTVNVSAKVHDTVGVTGGEYPKDTYSYWSGYSNETKTFAFGTWCISCTILM